MLTPQFLRALALFLLVDHDEANQEKPEKPKPRSTKPISRQSRARGKMLQPTDMRKKTG